MTLIHNYSDEDHQRLRGLNFNGCLGWTRLVLPQMYERKRGKKKNKQTNAFKISIFLVQVALYRLLLWRPYFPAKKDCTELTRYGKR
jgi:hypothetical protein